MLDAQNNKILHFVSYFSHHKQAIGTVLRASAVHLYCPVGAGEAENRMLKIILINLCMVLVVLNWFCL
jgi:hypothetical protein